MVVLEENTEPASGPEMEVDGYEQAMTGLENGASPSHTLIAELE